MTKRRDTTETRPARLPDGAPLDFAPDNEQGVVFLFSHLARKRFGLHVERVQSGFPDCVAYQDGNRVRIEFEYRSRNFRLHGHDPAGCDWLVCWIHDWPGVPEKIRVIELRREFGLGFNVWFQPVSGEFAEGLATIRVSDQWSVPSQSSPGDLLMFYRTRPDCFVRDVFRVAGRVLHVEAGWKDGRDFMAPIRRVATLKAPLHLAELREHRIVGTAGFVRGQMRGRYRASDYWPELYQMIIRRNPGTKAALQKYGPHRLT